MKRRHLLGLAAGITLVTTLGALVLGARAPSVTDPESARCNSPRLHFGPVRAYADHREVNVRFTCVGTDLVGTLAIPPGDDPHPAAVWVHGSGAAERLTYSGAPLVRELVHEGVAVLSYDKRGVGESTGECCPGDSGHFNLLAADAVGALRAVAARPEIDRSRIGFIGASQAGWVVPLAVVRGHGLVAFTALVDAPAVSAGQERLYSHMTGEEGGHPSDESQSDIIHEVRAAGPSEFDPEPLLAAQRFPSLWMYGGEDRSQPTTLDLEVLTRIRADNKEVRAIVFPEADHGLLDVPPSDPDALPAFVRWIHRNVHLAEN